MKEWFKGFGKFIVGFLLISAVLTGGHKVYVLCKAWSSVDSVTAANVTMDNFLKIKLGDSYDSVCKIMGGEGIVANMSDPYGRGLSFTASWCGGVKGLQPKYIIVGFNNDKRAESLVQLGLGEASGIAASAYKNINLGISYTTACALSGGSGCLNTVISSAYGSAEPADENLKRPFVQIYTWENGWGNGFQLTFFEGRLTKKRKIYFGSLDEYRAIEALGYVF
ncbi:hypothetical protein IJT93_01645 [bacterium]|nr:hypothetical protein [bacterium]